uniref:Multidrug efflux MFS transporter n=1 Tax=Streptomyces sp. NBC_00003 TaxID=2903608 RepID=A0AAU2VBM7_9ACTN
MVVVGAFLTQLDASLVNIGLATVADDLNAPLQTTQWIVSAYLLGLIVGLPLCSWISRRIGAGRLWLWSLGAFTLASVLCALAPNVQFLIVCRVLQGMTGGLLLPAGQTVIAQVAGRALMGRVMSTVGMALVLGPAAGPVIGGLLISHASWRWLFLVNLPVGALGLWLGRRFIPLGEPQDTSRFDFPGFVLIGFGLPAVTFAVSHLGQQQGSAVASFVTPLLLGLIALAGFVRHSLRGPVPLLKTKLFTNPAFAAASLSSFLSGAIQIGALTIWALYFQNVRGYSVVDAGLAMASFALGSAILPLSGRLTDKFGGGPVSLGGALLTTVAFVPAALLEQNASLLVLELCLFILGVGNALSVVPASTAAYVTVDPPEVPDAVTLINIFLRFGGAIGASLLVALLGDQSVSQSSLVIQFHKTFWWLGALSAASVIAAALLISTTRKSDNTTRN